MIIESNNSYVNTNSSIPLYIQAKENIIRRILSKEWKSGSRIPGEAELCQLFNVSRITVRKALDELQQEKYLEKFQGKGTFVSRESAVEQRLSKLYSFGNELRQKGIKEHAVLIEFSTIIVTLDLAQKLELISGEKAFKIERVRYADGTPYILEISYIPYQLARDLSEERIKSKGLYNSLRELGIFPATAEERFSAVNMDKNTADLLACTGNDAGISLTRTTYMGETIIEYCTSVVRGDFFSYTVQLR